MTHQIIQFTKEGYAKIENEFRALTEKRKGAVVALRTAREMGDLSENGAYHAAKWELGGIDRRLRRLSYLLKMGKVTEITNEGIVDFGRIITLDDGMQKLTFTLVNQFESNPTEGKLSTQSPIGQAVLGKRKGDTVHVNAPSGFKNYTIVDIQ